MYVGESCFWLWCECALFVNCVFCQSGNQRFKFIRELNLFVGLAWVPICRNFFGLMFLVRTFAGERVTARARIVLVARIGVMKWPERWSNNYSVLKATEFALISSLVKLRKIRKRQPHFWEYSGRERNCSWPLHCWFVWFLQLNIIFALTIYVVIFV